MEVFRGGPLIRGGGGGGGGGVMVIGFSLWSYFFDCKLKRTIFSRPYQNNQLVEHKTFFSPFISFDSPHTILSS